MKRLQLAFVTPLNPIPNGLSDYSELLLPALAEHADITLYSECGTPANPQIAAQFEVRPVRQLLRHHAQHDLRVYQIGNSPDHASAFDLLRYLPGVVVLHEPFLHHGLRGVSVQRYRRELMYESGYGGAATARQWATETDRERLLARPLIRRLIDSSLGLIVHSQAARHLVLNTASPRAPVLPIEVIPHLMDELPPLESRRARAEFGWPAEALLIGVPGTIDPTKEPALTVRAFAELSRQRPDARLIFMGDRPQDYGLNTLIADLGLDNRVEFMGRVEPLARLHTAMAACDIVVNLRRPTIGETSGTALRALALGRALIVRAVGWYGELPDEACVKIGAQAQADELAQAMLTLANSSEYRAQLARAGRRYIQTDCDVAAIARQYDAFGRSVYDRVNFHLTKDTYYDHTRFDHS